LRHPLAHVLGGLLPGALVALAATGPLHVKPWTIGAGMLTGAGVLLALGHRVERAVRSRAGAAAAREGDRSAAAAAGMGWAALPGLGAALLGLAPGPTVLAAACAALLLAALAAVALGWAPLGRQPVAAAFLGLAGGALGIFAASGSIAALGARIPTLGEKTAAAIYAVDARVPPQPLPQCAPEPRAVEVLLERGAHPRLQRDGARLWLDAPGPEGRRQIHALELATGSLRCWTCGQPGNNRHPSPSPGGRSVLFDTDRFARWSHPLDTELALLRAVKRDADGAGTSRRLTYHPGPDERPLHGPTGSSVVWSRGEGGRFEVVSASFRTGHGALLLARPRAVATGGGAYATPLAWSPNARSFAVGRGSGLGPLRLEVLDPATGRADSLGNGMGIDFSADGGRTALVRTAGAGARGLLPSGLGFLTARLARLAPDAAEAPVGKSTHLETGDTGALLPAVGLGEAGTWGAPTGVALGPEGTVAFVGQRREREGRLEERILRVELDCTFPEETAATPSAP